MLRRRAVGLVLSGKSTTSFVKFYSRTYPTLCKTSFNTQDISNLLVRESRHPCSSLKSFSQCSRYLDIQKLYKPPHSKSFSTMTEEVEEIKIPVPYGHIAGKIWRPQAPKTVLLLHGWLDNAGTFDLLAPLLPPHWRLVAIDFQGHGRSSHKPPGTPDTMLGYSLTVERVLRWLRVEKVAIIGHSMGAGVGMLYAGALPERVSDLVMLDFVKPISVSAEDQPRRTARAFRELLETEEKLAKGQRPHYPLEELVRRARAGRPLGDEAVRCLLERGAAEVAEGRHAFTYDLHTRAANVLQLTVEQQLAFVARLKDCRVMILRAKDGGTWEAESLYQKFVEAYRSSCAAFEYHSVPGHHHTHLDTPHAVAPHITAFLKHL